MQTCGLIHEAKNLLAHRSVLVTKSARANLPLLDDHKQNNSNVESEDAKILVSSHHPFLPFQTPAYILNDFRLRGVRAA